MQNCLPGRQQQQQYIPYKLPRKVPNVTQHKIRSFPLSALFSDTFLGAEAAKKKKKTKFSGISGKTILNSAYQKVETVRKCLNYVVEHYFAQFGKR